MMTTNTDRSSYQAAYRLVDNVLTWKWPHRRTVYPVDRYVPIMDTTNAKRGYSKLLRVHSYLANQVRKDFMRGSDA